MWAEWTWQATHPSEMAQGEAQVVIIGKYGVSGQRKGGQTWRSLLRSV